jgi:hypothetical protein
MNCFASPEKNNWNEIAIQSIGELFKKKESRITEGKQIMHLLPMLPINSIKSTGNNLVFMEKPNFQLNKMKLVMLIGKPNIKKNDQYFYSLGQNKLGSHVLVISFKDNFVINSNIVTTL